MTIIPGLDHETCDMVRELCIACGAGIDRIAKKKNLPQHLLAKLFVEMFQMILKSMEDK